MPPTPKKQPSRATLLRQTAQIPALRQRVLEAQHLYGTQVLADPVLHRLVSNFLFTSYDALPTSQREWAFEYVEAYRYLLDGKPVDGLQVPSLNRTETIEHIKAFLRGDLIRIHGEEERDQED